LISGSALSHADNNLLVNGDFSRGIAHWEGDCHTLDSGSGDLGAPSGPPTVGVKLRSHDWTSVTQNFQGKAGTYHLTISYTLSPDIQFSHKPEDYSDIGGSINFHFLRAAYCTPGNWEVTVVNVDDGNGPVWNISPRTSGPDPLSIDGTFEMKTSGNFAFCLALPPGQGVVTLKNISFVPST
jgi:hypothetical protein